MPLILGALCIVALVACSLDTSASLPDDGAPGDSATGDATTADSTPPDTGAAPVDSSAVSDSMAGDSGATDSGATDSGARDTGPADTGAPGCTTGPAGADVAVALPAPAGITVDGDLSDWSWAQWRDVTTSDWQNRGGPAPGSDADLSARVAVQWTTSALYVAAVVTDDTHFNDRSGWPIWEGDSIQVAFDMAQNAGGAYDNTDDFEYGWANTTSGVESYRWHAPTGAPAASVSAEVLRASTTTTYEARLTAGDLGVSAFGAGDDFGFSWIVNELDAPGGSEGYEHWTAGIAEGKNPGLFGDLVLRDCD